MVHWLDVPGGMSYLGRSLPTITANLALDEALLEAAEEGGPPVLWIWEADRLAVVMGASGRLAEDVRLEACGADCVEIARRSSGGGTVLIGPGALNVTVVLPVALAPELASVPGAQKFVLERVAWALRALGPAVEVLGSGDLTLGNRKFAGSAQRRLRRHVLVHSSILYNFPLEAISRYTELPRRQPAYRQGRSHAEFLTSLPLPRDQIVEAIRSAWLTEPAPQAEVPEARVQHLVATKFGDRAWIERF
jgi:lipoate---protein ligase